MTQEEFEQGLARRKARAEEVAAALTGAPAARMEGLLREYIACRYFLDAEEMTTDRLVDLGEQSTAKMAGWKRAGLQFAETSAGCTAASSGVIKKMLLAIALGRIIGISLDPDAVAAADTIGQLAALAAATRDKGAEP